MSTFSNLRQIKISSLYTKPRWSNGKFKPKLILSGDWLQKAGFEIGENVTISVCENLLIIQKINL